MTYTYAILEVNDEAYDEIRAKLAEARGDTDFLDAVSGYQLPVIDMHGLAIACDTRGPLKMRGDKGEASGIEAGLHVLLDLSALIAAIKNDPKSAEERSKALVERLKALLKRHSMLARAERRGLSLGKMTPDALAQLQAEVDDYWNEIIAEDPQLDDVEGFLTLLRDGGKA